MHLVLLPPASEYASIRPLVRALPMNHVIQEAPSVARPVGPLKHTLSLLKTFNEFSIIARTVVPPLDTAPVLQVIEP